MDLRMPVMDGVEAMRKIGAQVPSAHVIVLTTYDNDEYIFRGIEAGARAYLLKDAPRDELFHAIREVHQGKSLIDPSVVDKVFERFASQSKLTSGQEALSEREKGILRLMATGAPKQGDRGTALHQREHGQDPRPIHLSEAGGERPHRSGDPRIADGYHLPLACTHLHRRGFGVAAKDCYYWHHLTRHGTVPTRCSARRPRTSAPRDHAGSSVEKWGFKLTKDMTGWLLPSVLAVALVMVALLAAPTAPQTSPGKPAAPLGDSDQFVRAAAYEVGEDLFAVVTGDMNGDSLPDIVVTGYRSGTVSMLLNKGNGVFAETPRYPSGQGSFGLALEDMDGDADLDVLVANQATGILSILYNRGDGMLETRTDVSAGGSPHTVAVAEFNGDSLPDLALPAYQVGAASVYLNLGNGSFSERAVHGTHEAPFWALAVDIDGNNRPAIVTTSYSQGFLDVLWNNGKGEFGILSSYEIGESLWSLSAADVDGNGTQDIIVTQYTNGTVSVFRIPATAPLVRRWSTPRAAPAPPGPRHSI
jgi:hypothetical protein